jgi:hypothetical protein
VHDETATSERQGGDGAIMATLVKISGNIIDFRLIGEYYIKIDCECGFQWATVRRNGVMKRVRRVIRDHACEIEKGQG